MTFTVQPFLNDEEIRSARSAKQNCIELEEKLSADLAALREQNPEFFKQVHDTVSELYAARQRHYLCDALLAQVEDAEDSE